MKDLVKKIEQGVNSSENLAENTLHAENFKWSFYVALKNKLSHHQLLGDQLKVMPKLETRLVQYNFFYYGDWKFCFIYNLTNNLMISYKCRI